jgi:hypothetical protein
VLASTLMISVPCGPFGPGLVRTSRLAPGSLGPICARIPQNYEVSCPTSPENFCNNISGLPYLADLPYLCFGKFPGKSRATHPKGHAPRNPVGEVERPLPPSPKRKSGCRSQKSARTRRAYRLDVQHFMRTLSIGTPEELRQADHKAVIAWERYMPAVLPLEPDAGRVRNRPGVPLSRDAQPFACTRSGNQRRSMWTRMTCRIGAEGAGFCAIGSAAPRRQCQR